MFTVMAVVAESREQAAEWARLTGFMGEVLIKNPYRAIHKVYTKIPFIITRKENATIIKNYPLTLKLPENIKNHANCVFK